MTDPQRVVPSLPPGAKPGDIITLAANGAGETHWLITEATVQSGEVEEEPRWSRRTVKADSLRLTLTRVGIIR